MSSFLIPIPESSTVIMSLTFPGKRILVIDDNTLNLKVALRVLEPYKIEVDTAKSGDEGI